MVQGTHPAVPSPLLQHLTRTYTDLPPTGGYAPIQYKRNIPARGLRPVYYLAGVLGICTFGFYKWAQSSRELQLLLSSHLFPNYNN